MNQELIALEAKEDFIYYTDKIEHLVKAIESLKEFYRIDRGEAKGIYAIINTLDEELIILITLASELENKYGEWF